MKYVLPVVAMATIFFLTACGQKGPLYLPDEHSSVDYQQTDIMYSQYVNADNASQQVQGKLNQESVNG